MNSTTLFSQQLSQALHSQLGKHPLEKYQDSPAKFVNDVLGLELTEDQHNVCKGLSTRDRVSVKSGHGVGKSCIAACLALWFKYTYWPSVVITTAPTERQVKQILWREIRARKANATIPLEGKPLTMHLELGPLDYMIGISTNDAQQFQGFHSPNIMVIVDEANGYPEEMFTAIDGLLSGGERKILFQIGNPIEPSGRFFNSCNDGETLVYTISCLSHPNVKTGKNIIPGAVTKEWVNRMKRLWGEDSAFWSSRILGEFPKTATDTVIQLWWLERAEAAFVTGLEHKDEGEVYMGVDPSEYGGDPWVWFIGTSRRKIKVEERAGIEPAEGIGITKRFQKSYSIAGKSVTIDGIGAGATVYSVLRQDGMECNRFVASSIAKNSKEYEDASTEAWFSLRNLLNPDGDEYRGYALNGPAEKVKADLCTRKYQTSRHGRLMLEPKEKYRHRLKRSPNYGDAMALCYYPLVSRRVYGYIILPSVY